MRRNPKFKDDVLGSTYFDPAGTKGAAGVLVSWHKPFADQTLYKHIKNHMVTDVTLAEERRAKLLLGPVKTDILQTDPGTSHMQGLEEFIAQGRTMLHQGRLQITGTTYLQAIKIKADVVEKNKDRKLDAIKAFFGAKAADGPPNDGPNPLISD